MRAGCLKFSTRDLNSSTTPVQSATLGSTWLCRPARNSSVADWLEDLTDIPEDIRNLQVQYTGPGYIRQGRVVLNSAHPQSAPPGRARCRFRSAVL